MAGGDLEALLQSTDGEGLQLEVALRIGDEVAQASRGSSRTLA